jgi:hypothetical protein
MKGETAAASGYANAAVAQPADDDLSGAAIMHLPTFPQLLHWTVVLLQP